VAAARHTAHPLDPPCVYPSAIIDRERAVVCNLERIRCIITADEATPTARGVPRRTSPCGGTSMSCSVDSSTALTTCCLSSSPLRLRSRPHAPSSTHRSDPNSLFYGDTNGMSHSTFVVCAHRMDENSFGGPLSVLRFCIGHNQCAITLHCVFDKNCHSAIISGLTSTFHPHIWL
jgi:hypothetical protein